MSLKKLLFVTIALFSIQYLTAQRNYDQNNYLGLAGGIGFFDIITDDFATDRGNGYFFGFTTRGAFYNNFDLIYGITFVQNEIGILARNLDDPTNQFQSQFVDYTMISAQVNLLASMYIINKHLSIEAGPVLNVNGKLNIDDEDFENFLIDGYDNLRSGDIENVSRVHFYGVAGISGGIENFRVGAQYQYGVTNLFNRFNDNADIEKPNGKFEGHTSTILLTATLYF